MNGVSRVVRPVALGVRMASTAAPHPGPDFTVRKDPAWYDTDGFAHPELKKTFDGLDKHNPNLVWAPFIPGITAVWLYRPEHSSTGKASSALLKFSPGASVGNHWHRGWEHVICLEGSFQDERGTFGRGSVMYNPPGSHHRGLHSKDGCIVLMLWEESVGFMEAANKAAAQSKKHQ